jgi:3',5'-cyclic AMP phosphodiesterase CpdA
MTIAHLSDLHFGKIAHDEIVPHLVEEVNQAAVDLVAVSGDLTQRARTHEFEAAAAMLRAFDAPALVVPGNHDVYPWWHPISRLTRPCARFRRYVSENLAPTFEWGAPNNGTHSGVAVLGLNTAVGRTVKAGRIASEDLDRMRTFFRERETAFKVLVLHHHLTKIQGLGPHDVAKRAERALEVASEAGVDLVLCGHLHISHIEPVEVIPGSHRLVVASAGTATSTRGRRRDRRTNFYNRVRVRPGAFFIEERRYDADEHAFVLDSTTRFERLQVA